MGSKSQWGWLVGAAVVAAATVLILTSDIGSDSSPKSPPSDVQLADNTGPGSGDVEEQPAGPGSGDVEEQPSGPGSGDVEEQPSGPGSGDVEEQPAGPGSGDVEEQPSGPGSGDVEEQPSGPGSGEVEEKPGGPGSGDTVPPADLTNGMNALMAWADTLTERTGPGSGDTEPPDQPQGPGSGDVVQPGDFGSAMATLQAWREQMATPSGPGSGDVVFPTLSPADLQTISEELSLTLVVGSCNVISAHSSCFDFIGDYWNETTIRLACDNVGMYSPEPCPSGSLGGCRRGTDTEFDNVLWVYPIGADALTMAHMPLFAWICENLGHKFVTQP
ncbi:MAG: hypothetical protein D6681_04620 [Calditrichaeota bacterium]|nr:MAG: hypothetical protein D6681_04620 [Calditrichota bacterium]